CALTGEQHRRTTGSDTTRRMVQAPFTIKRVEAMRPAVQRIVDDRIDELLAGPRPVDLVRAFALRGATTSSGC
ncbi:hypothetical protein ACFUYE_11150, partial [Micromonospora humida]